VINLLFKEQQQPGNDDGAECDEIDESNNREPDPGRFFLIGHTANDIRIAGDVFSWIT